MDIPGSPIVPHNHRDHRVYNFVRCFPSKYRNPGFVTTSNGIHAGGVAPAGQTATPCQIQSRYPVLRGTGFAAVRFNTTSITAIDESN